MGSPEYISANIALRKMADTDRDLRYMILSDMLKELQGGSLIRSNEQEAVYRKVYSLLQDPSNEVQGMAMRLLPVLLKNMSVNIAEEAGRNLIESLLKPTKSDADMAVRSMKDVSTLLLKTTFTELPADTDVTKALIDVVVPKVLSDGLGGPENVPVQVDCLDILKDLLIKFKELMASYHTMIVNAVYEKLESPTTTIRKKSASTLACMSTVCSLSLFNEFMEKLVKPLEDGNLSTSEVRSRLQTCSVIARAAAHRIQPEVATELMQQIFRSMKDLSSEDLDTFEAALQTLDAFATKNPKELVQFMDETLQLLGRCVKYDPNYADDSDEMMDEAENDLMEDVEDDEELEDEFAYDSDDDDMSWKVRRAALRCAHSIVQKRILDVARMYNIMGILLISRLSERETFVKTEVYDTLADILRQVSEGTGLELDDAMDIDSREVNPAGGNDGSDGELVQKVRNVAPKLVNAIRKEFAAKPTKCAVGALHVLREVINIAPNEVAPFMTKLKPELEKILNDPNVQIKSAILGLIARVNFTDPTILHLLPLVLKIAEDRFYKITAEAFRLCARILIAINTASKDMRLAAKDFIIQAHSMAKARTVAPDQDSEVKDGAIDNLGICVGFYADLLVDSPVESTTIICERLSHEVTRVAAVKAIQRIAASPNADAMSSVLNQLESTLCSFLHKQNVVLRRWTLKALMDLVPRLPSNNDEELLQQIGPMISEQDLRLSAYAVFVVVRLVYSRQGAIVPALKRIVWVPILQLATSPLLQGQVLEAVFDLLSALVKANEEPLRSADISEDLQKVAIEYAAKNRRSVPYSAARCVAKLIKESPIENQTAVRVQLAEDLKSEVTARKLFALACIAQLGRESSIPGDLLKQDIRDSVLKILLESTHEEERSTAAIAFGAISSSDGETGVQFFIKLIQERPEKRYLLLISLKETITFMDPKAVAQYAPHLLPLLLEEEQKISQAANEEGVDASISTDAGQESMRTATAECLGLLARVNPDHVLQLLEEIYLEPSKVVPLRAASVLAIKYSLGGETSAELEENLKKRLAGFSRLLADPEVIEPREAPVVRGAILSLDAVTRTRPALFVECGPELLPRIYKLMKSNKRLVRSINLGPFKYEEDEGLEIRKASFALLGSVLVKAPRLIDISAYSEVIASGLQDSAEVRTLAQFNLIDIVRSPLALGILSGLHMIVEALSSVLKAKAKENAVSQEIERHEDALRGALRVVIAMEKVQDIASDFSFQSLLKEVTSSPDLHTKYETLSKETVASRK